MKNTITALLLAIVGTFMAQTATAGDFTDNLKYNFRFGYMLGGTAPVGMPATIRSLDSYRLQPNLTFGIDVTRPLGGRWGITTGLRLENKGMKIKATVKNYHMAFVQGDQRVEGNFTGGNYTEVEEHMITIPLMVSFDVTNNCHIKAGAYASMLTSRKFSGYAYDGYLREGDPTGSKIPIGHDATDRGDYDFSDEMRHFQVGLTAYADYYWNKHWGAFIDITWGLNGIFNGCFETLDQSLYPIYGTIGLCYRLK